ncbi:condensation domain-containing protein, partial [Aquimarina sp. AU474]|uniref:condensation domain-containing protein n=1 Tax=Aquimarina sp. AU474 TaxID=2108529 RepID=UPI001F2B4D3F
LRIDMEGHGREEVIAGIDISRTVGWFTSIYPVLLSITDPSMDLSGIIKSVKECLRGIPNNGFDYLLYKYLDASIDLGDIDSSQISFNYLGQFDSDTSDKVFEIAKESVGDEHSSTQDREYEWDISGMVSAGQLHMSLVYSGLRHDASKVDSFMQSYASHLESIISYCLSYEGVSLTPSDLSYKGLSISALDDLASRYAIADVYPLSPMQEGMLFHWLLDNDSDHYFNQVSYGVVGDLDITLFEKSYDALISRYDILRTIFLHEGYDVNLQVVLKEQKRAFEYRDVREEVLSSDRSSVVKKYVALDRSNKFDLTSDALMRVGVYHLGDKDYEIIWSFHHILMDGWCMSILVQDFNSFYQGYVSGDTLE